MDRINEILAKLTLEKGKGNQAKVARALGEKPQTFGNYIKGRTLPVSLIEKWKEVYGEDLLQLAKKPASTIVSKSVSRETNVDNVITGPVKVLPMDAWELLQDDNKEFKNEIKNLWDMIRFLKGQSITPHK